MKRFILVSVSLLIILAGSSSAFAGHYEWKWQGVNSGWVWYEGDTAQYHDNTEPATSNSPPKRTQADQPLGRTAPPIVTQQQIQKEQNARRQFNQQQLNQGKTNFKPTLLSGYKRP